MVGWKHDLTVEEILSERGKHFTREHLLTAFLANLWILSVAGWIKSQFTEDW